MVRHALTPAGGFSEEVFGLFLDEAERALLDVETRMDEPNRRVASEPDLDGISGLEQAIAELADAYPGLQAEVEAVSDRLRCAGTSAAVQDLEARPQVVQLVRLSLEVFFRRFPTAHAFELAQVEDCDSGEDDGPSPGEIFEANRRLLTILRPWVS